jgi:hypothetical protein
VGEGGAREELGLPDVSRRVGRADATRFSARKVSEPHSGLSQNEAQLGAAA